MDANQMESTIEQPKPILKSNVLGNLNKGVQGYIASVNAGKTTLLFNDAVDLALEGKRVTIVSLELNKLAVIEMLLNIAGPNNEDVVFDHIDILCLSINDVTIAVLVDILRQRDCDLVVIDYMQLIRFNSGIDVNDSRLNTLVVLDHLGRDIEKPIITALQMNRESMYSKELSRSDDSVASKFNFVPVYNVDGILNIEDDKWEIEENTRKVKKVIDN